MIITPFLFLFSHHKDVKNRLLGYKKQIIGMQETDP